jgi:hypothetical protein
MLRTMIDRPKNVAAETNALAARHVKYNVPPRLLKPFSMCVADALIKVLFCEDWRTSNSLKMKFFMDQKRKGKKGDKDTDKKEEKKKKNKKTLEETADPNAEETLLEDNYKENYKKPGSEKDGKATSMGRETGEELDLDRHIPEDDADTDSDVNSMGSGAARKESMDMMRQDSGDDIGSNGKPRKDSMDGVQLRFGDEEVREVEEIKKEEELDEAEKLRREMREKKQVIIAQGYVFLFSYVLQVMGNTIRAGRNAIVGAMIENSLPSLEHALGQVPRGIRNAILLECHSERVTLSPFLWALESGKLVMGRFILNDLITIRGDRKDYYCGLEELYTKFPKIVTMMSEWAPSLLTQLFDGMVWCSPHVQDGMRRVNYYIKYIYGPPEVFDTPEKLLKESPVACLVRMRDAQIFMHPTIRFTVELKWEKFGRMLYIRRRAVYRLLSVISYSVGYLAGSSEHFHSPYLFTLRAICMMFVFLVPPMRDAEVSNVQGGYQRENAVQQKIQFVKKKITNCLALMKHYSCFRGRDTAETVSIMFCILAIGFDPFLHIDLFEVDPDYYYYGGKDTGNGVMSAWLSEWGLFKITAAMTALTVTYLSLHVLALSVRMAAFYVMILHVLPELMKFLVLALMLLYGFASAVTITMTDDPETPHHKGEQHDLTFWDVSYALFNAWIANEGTLVGDMLHAADTPPLAFLFVTGYGVVMTVLLLRLLTAQLSCSYQRLLHETQGFAVLSAANFVLQLESVLKPEQRQKLYDDHKFEARLPFDRMDLGISGGIQVFDPLNKWPSIEHDRVQRLTGAAGADEPWPKPPAEITIEERLIGLDTRVRQIIAQAGMDKDKSGGMGEGVDAMPMDEGGASQKEDGGDAKESKRSGSGTRKSRQSGGARGRKSQGTGRNSSRGKKEQKASSKGDEH